MKVKKNVKVDNQPGPFFIHSACNKRQVGEQPHLLFEGHVELFCLHCQKVVNVNELQDQMAYRLHLMIKSGMNSGEARKVLAQQYRTELQAEATRSGKRVA